MTDLSVLNARFGAIAPVRFRELPGGLVVVEVTNVHSSGVIALQGAHLMSWRPAPAADPVIWLSPEAKLAPGKSIRGGVPVCWPWFGPHATEPHLPAHGFARTEPWEMIEVRTLADGATEANLMLTESERTRALWPSGARLSLRIRLGATLALELCTENTGAHDIIIGEALHTYFQIGDIGAVRVTGLEACDYLDKVGGGSARRRQAGAVEFSAETDRIYSDPGPECALEDVRLSRRIRVRKSSSRSTVIWNPWEAKAERLGDLGRDGWRRMLCIESANAADELVTIAPGERHTLAAEYRVETLGG